MEIVTGFELDTDEVGAMAKTLLAVPTAPETAVAVPASSLFPDLTTACAGFRTRWATGIDAMGQDVTRMGESVQQTVITYLACDQRASTTLGR